MSEPERQGQRSRRGVEVVVLALVALMALARYWCSPADALEHLLDPDGVEYTVSAERFGRGEGLTIVVDGHVHPIRYAPAFPVLFLAPVYRVAPAHLGNGIYPVTALAILGALAAYGLGRALTGWTWGGDRSARWPGILAAAAYVYHPTLTAIHRSIQSDGPSVSLAVIALFLLARAFAPAEGSRRRVTALLALGGLAIGLSAAVRPLMGLITLGLIVLTLLWPGVPKRHRWTGTALLALPTLLAGIATAIYQQRTFGSPTRTGYAYWTPLPYEWADQVFSLRYLAVNWFWAGTSILIALGSAALGIAILSRTCQRKTVLACLACFAVVAPITLAHLLYCWPDYRFHAPLMAVGMILGGAGVGAAIMRLKQNIDPLAFVVAMIFLAALLAVPYRTGMPSHPDYWDRILIQNCLPPGSVVVADMNSALFNETLGRMGYRQIIGSRAAEYASKLVAPVPLGPRPEGLIWPGSHRDPRLAMAGARNAVGQVAAENPELVLAELRAGKAVYLVDKRGTLHDLRKSFVLDESSRPFPKIVAGATAEGAAP